MTIPTSPFSNDSTSSQVRVGIGWWIANGLTFFLSAGLQFKIAAARGTNSPELVGTILGLIFWPLVIVAICSIWEKNRNRKTQVKVLFLVSVFFLLSSFGTFSTVHPNAASAGRLGGTAVETKKMAVRLESDYRKLNAEALSGNGKIENSIPVSSPASGDTGIIEIFIRQHIADAVTQRNDYLSDLESIGWLTVLDGKRIKFDTSLRDTKKILIGARTLIDEYQSASAALMDSVPSKANKLALTEYSKREFLAGFEKTAKATKERDALLWTIERKIITQVEAAALLVGSNRQKWTYENRQFIFSNNDTLALFNAHMAEIDDLTRKQAEIQKESADLTLARLQKMKK